MPPFGRFQRVLRAIFEMQLKLSMFALVAMMLIIVADVFMRYAFNAPIPGSYDLVGIALAVMVFFGLAQVIADRAEITIDIIDNLGSAAFVRLLTFIAGLAALGVLVFVFWSMVGPMLSAYRYGDKSLELNVPVWIIWVVSLIGLSGAVLAAFLTVLSPVSDNARPDERGSEQ